MKFNYFIFQQLQNASISWWMTVLIVLLNIHQITAQIETTVFQHYTINDGLASNSVNDIEVDNEGFIWIATEAGLNRFDGYEFRTYVYHPKDSNAIINSQVTNLTVNDAGNIWVGVYDTSFDLYDQTLERFIHYNTKVRTTCIMEDSQGDLLIGTYESLWRIKKGETSCDSVPEAGHITVSSLYKDQYGVIWVGAVGKLVKYNTIQKQFYTYNTNFDSKAICEDYEGKFWIGTYQKGLVLFDRQTGAKTFYQHDPDDSQSISSNQLSSIYEDSQKNLWIGTEQGLNLFDRKNGTFTRYQHDIMDRYSISANNITSICEDQGGNLWIGTKGGGINMLPAQRNPFYHYNHVPDNPLSLSHNEVTSFCERADGNVWIGTNGGGLNLFNRKDNVFIQYPPLSENGKIGMAIMEDSDGYTWVSSQGLHRFLPTQNHRYENKTSWPFNAWYIFEDSQNEVWISSLFIFERFIKNPEDPSSYIRRKPFTAKIESPFTSSVYEDRNKNIWICAPHGLYRYDRNHDQYKRYNQLTQKILGEKEGKLLLSEPNGVSYYDWENDSLIPYLDFGGIVPIDECFDDNGNCWIISPNGLYCVNPHDNSIKKYDQSDGLKINQFNFWATMKSRTGELFLGGDNGFVVFHPDSIKENPYIPPVVITDFLLSNQSVPVRENFGDSTDFSSPLEISIQKTEAIILPYRQNVFSFEFAALNYTSAKKNLFKYKMEGFNKEWIYTNAGNRTATYTNLNPGEYTFTVSGSNNDGIWNAKGKSIRITILPPWWLSWWAYIFYVMAFICLAWLIIRDIRRRDRMKAHLQIEHLELRKMQELDELKNQFFTNISHEFRTPLTLILGPLKQLYEGTFKGNQGNIFSMMIRNCNRLLKLINQLLYFSKLDAGVIPLRTSKMDIVVFLKLVFANFESIAQSRKIRYFFQSDTSELMVYLDTKHFEKVIINLLSNAFKFTLEDCEIYLKVSKNVKDPVIDKGEGIVEIQVIDSGTGIEKEKLPYIFDRFYQADGANSRVQEGAGIGLALVKELVNLHYGSIQVVSKKGKGASFIIHLPLGKSHLNDEEIFDASIYERSENELEEISQFDSSSNENEVQNGNPPIILIIDDNVDMRSYISEILIDEYRVIEASNGKQGLKEAIELIPDLIVTDVMMPEMDGYELCQKLKTDERTSHIPVILLTAKADQKAKIEGYETGADDYITKPFNHDELRIRIKNLIEQREELRQRFNKNISLGPGELAITSADEKFLTRAIKIIDDHIEDPNLGAEFFAKEIGLSRSQLHRKLKALTDQSAIEFIRSYRLIYARQLLEKHYGNIAEITYAVGFNNPSYFAECFKKQFGVLPSKYVENKSSSTQKKY